MAVRTLVDGGVRYLYLVNCDCYPEPVEVKLKNTTGKATDLATGKSVEAPSQWHLTLEPYQLRSFSLDSYVEVVEAVATPPRAVTIQLTKEGNAILDRIAKAKAAGKSLSPEIEQAAAQIQYHLQNSRWSSLRHAIKVIAIANIIP